VGVLGVILILSIALNVIQYTDQHRLGFVSNIKINSTPAPNSIVWNGRMYWTDGERNPIFADLLWLGVGKAGSKNVNIFEVVGVNPQTEVDYILGNRLVTASSKQ